MLVWIEAKLGDRKCIYLVTANGKIFFFFFNILNFAREKMNKQRFDFRYFDCGDVIFNYFSAVR